MAEGPSMPKEWFPVNPILAKMMSSETKTKAVEVTLLGFDHLGHVFLQLNGPEFLRPHNEIMRRVLSQVYDNCSELSSHLKATNVECVPGNIYAALVPEDDGSYRFIRGEVLELVDNKAILNDLDTQMKYKVKQRKLFHMVKEMYKIPLMTVRCSLRFLSVFTRGTSAIVDAAKVKATMSTEYFFGKFYLDKKNPQTPLVELYHNLDECKDKIWSFNFDVLTQIISWNGHFDFEKNMLIDNIKISHVLPNGRVWIQFQSGVLDAVIAAEPIVNWNVITSYQLKKDIDEQLNIEDRSKLFMIRDRDNLEKFVRVKVLGSLGDKEKENYTGELLVELYDYGTKKVIHKSELIPAVYFDSIVLDIPPQVLQAEVANPPYCGLSREEIFKLTSDQFKKRILIKEPFVYGGLAEFPKVEIYVLNHAAAQEEAEKDEVKASMVVPGVDCVLFPYPCEGREEKGPGRTFDYTMDLNKIRGIAEICPIISAMRT